MLEIEDLHVFYGEIHALKGAALTVRRGEIVTVLGSNGAGKTTTLKSISGLLAPRRGRIMLEGRQISGVPPHEVVLRGIAHVPEGRRIFNRLSVRENLVMGAYLRRDEGVPADLDRVFALFPVLRERLAQVAGTLSGGEQQMLAIARGLMAKPKLLLMDEPSLGLSPLLVKNIFEIIKEINRQGTTILLVEQNVYQSLRITHRAYVLETGRVVLSGTGAELLENAHVKKAFLGM